MNNGWIIPLATTALYGWMQVHFNVLFRRYRKAGNFDAAIRTCDTALLWTIIVGIGWVASIIWWAAQ